MPGGERYQETADAVFRVMYNHPSIVSSSILSMSPTSASYHVILPLPKCSRCFMR